jgi:hypothetical protein
VVTLADGYAAREAAKVMIDDARQALGDPTREITLGADKGYDAVEFIEACKALKVTCHVAQKQVRSPVGGARINRPECGLRGFPAIAQALRKGFRLGQEHRRFALGDSAGLEEGGVDYSK